MVVNSGEDGKLSNPFGKSKRTVRAGEVDSDKERRGDPG